MMCTCVSNRWSLLLKLLEIHSDLQHIHSVSGLISSKHIICKRWNHVDWWTRLNSRLVVLTSTSWPSCGLVCSVLALTLSHRSVFQPLDSPLTTSADSPSLRSVSSDSRLPQNRPLVCLKILSDMFSTLPSLRFKRSCGMCLTSVWV